MTSMLGESHADSKSQCDDRTHGGKRPDQPPSVSSRCARGSWLAVATPRPLIVGVNRPASPSLSG